MKKQTLVFAVLMLASISLFAADAGERAEDFVARAAVSNQFEIVVSQLAVERSENTIVQEFAENMMDDHGTAGEELARAVEQSDLDLTIPEFLDERHTAMVEELRATNGDFDEKYIEMQVAAHKDAVRLFEKFGGEQDNERNLREFAIKTLPTLRSHRQLAEGMAGRNVD